MKKYLILILSLYGCIIHAQNTSITINNKTIAGTEHAGGWIFENETDSIIALEKSTYKLLISNYKKLEAEIQRQEASIKAKDKLIDAYENYELKADVHINKQDSLISMADSLYRGYKDIYHDLKSIAGMQSFGLVFGAGFNKYDQQNAAFLFDAGVEYNQVQLNYQFGKKYKGLIVKYRIPLF